jgi:hypothetical protein
MRYSLILMSILLIARVFAQTPDPGHLSSEEVTVAAAAKPDSGFVYPEDMSFATPSICNAQMPSEAIFTPAGWINAQSVSAKKQFLPFQPTEDDTLNALTVISKGCASGASGGPVCDAITRVALLSDKSGGIVVEAISTKPFTMSYQNGYGATAACSAMLSRFAMADLKKVRNGKGEFLIATFNSSELLKIYVVKEKHLKKLGL